MKRQSRRYPPRRAGGVGGSATGWRAGRTDPLESAGGQKLGGGGNPVNPGRPWRATVAVVVGREPDDQAVERLIGERGQHQMRAAVALAGGRIDGEDPGRRPRPPPKGRKRVPISEWQKES